MDRLGDSSLGIDGGWFGARSARASFGGIEVGLLWVVGARSLWLFDDLLDEAIVTVREIVASIIAVEGGGKASYEDAFPNASFVPIRFT